MVNYEHLTAVLRCAQPLNKRDMNRLQIVFESLLYDFYLSIKDLLEYSPSNGTVFFGNSIKSKMGTLNLIRKIYFNQKTLTKNIFF